MIYGADRNARRDEIEPKNDEFGSELAPKEKNTPR